MSLKCEPFSEEDLFGLREVALVFEQHVRHSLRNEYVLVYVPLFVVRV